MKNKGFTLVELLAVIVVLGIIAAIAVPTVNSSMKKARNKAYDAQIAQIENEAKRWAVDHNNELPAIGSTTKSAVNVDMLIKGGYITKTKDGVLYNPKDPNKTMDGCVVIEYSSEYNQYTYNYEEVCSVKMPELLVDELLKQYSASNTVGLLKDETGYYYKGSNTEVANNYVWFGGHLWRVIGIDNDNNLTMITQQPITAIQPASAVWTTQAAYEASYINHWLNDMTDGVFLKSMEEVDRNKIINSNFNVGTSSNISEITTSQKVGLLDKEQYSNAGSGNSFLYIDEVFWLLNRNSNQLLAAINSQINSVIPVNITYSYGVRPVIKISNLTFTSGKGTLEDPYRDSSTTTNTSDIKVGEYISIPTTGNDCGEDKRCLFRVISKDNDSIKVILNGLLSNTSTTSITYTSGSTIDTKVTTFVNTINSSYRYSGTDKTFGIGTYSDGANYTVVQGTTYIGNVGLPVVGEMFTGNDIDMSDSVTKTFVNVATIENPTVSNSFWTINAYGESSVRSVNNHGTLSSGGVYNPSGSASSGTVNTYGVRPVLFLNNNLTFTGGEGTAEHPFMLG